MTPYEQIAEAIIKKFIFILGHDEAIRRAQKIGGLTVSDEGGVKMDGEHPKAQLEELINHYRNAFGPAAIVFCRNASDALVKQNPQLEFPDVIKIEVKPW